MTYQKDSLSALSHPTRQEIVALLRHAPHTVGELAENLPVTRPAVSQHLQALKLAGLVEEQRRGTRHYFCLNPKTLEELRSHIDGMWRDALAGFAEFAGEIQDKHKEVKRNAATTKKRKSRRAGPAKRST